MGERLRVVDGRGRACWAEVARAVAREAPSARGYRTVGSNAAAAMAGLRDRLAP